MKVITNHNVALANQKNLTSQPINVIFSTIPFFPYRFYDFLLTTN